MEQGWIDSQLAKFPSASKDILEFIDKFVSYYPDGILELFDDEYCYFFAAMLKDVFRTGDIVWLKYQSHILYREYNGVCYDIHGVYEDCDTDADLIEFNRLSYVERGLFKHDPRIEKLPESVLNDAHEHTLKLAKIDDELLEKIAKACNQ